MKVCFLNQQNKYKTGKPLKDLIRKCVLTSLEYMEFPTATEVSVVLTDNDGIRDLNKLHRNIDKPTDVLSFPMFEYDEDGNIIEDFAEYSDMGELILGDIVISLERAAEQAEEYGHGFDREVGFLTVHSMLHLFGYDHLTPEDEKEMFGFQEEILNKIGLVK